MLALFSVALCGRLDNAQLPGSPYSWLRLRFELVTAFLISMTCLLFPTSYFFHCVLFFLCCSYALFSLFKDLLKQQF